MIKVKFKKWNCVAVFSQYRNNNRLAIQLVDEKTGEEVATASVNIPDHNIFEDNIAIKNYSENEGMVEALQQAGIIGKQIDTYNSGHVKIGIYELLCIDK